MNKNFIDFEYEIRALFFGFIEATSNLDESFCDCNSENGKHEGECTTTLFRLDVATLEARYDEIYKKYKERFAIQSKADECVFEVK